MKNCSILFTLAFVLLSFTTVNASPYRNCSSVLGVATDVRVSDCSSSPCILKKGGSVSIEIDFIPSADIATLTDRVKGIISGIKLPFSTDNPDTCKDKGFTCPLKAGQKYTYKSSIPISTLYPSIRLIVEWAAIDANDKEAFCIQIPAEIRAFAH